MRVVMAGMMALHGAAHLIGFLTSWRLLTPDGEEYQTTVMAGRVDLGSAGIRTFGVLWLATAVAFWVASLAAFADRSWWVPSALGAALVSLVLSLIALPDSRVGVPINIAIIVALLAGLWFG